MEVFKKPWVAVLVSIALVLASTLISAGTKLDRKAAEVTDGFYEGVTYDGYKHPSIYSQLRNLCGAADGIAAIAANNGIDCDELTKASNGLKASISTMHDNISAIYESYSTLSGALSEFLLRLPEDQLSARELEGLEQYRQTVDGTASVIDEAGYNESVRSFRSTLLFPADVFMFVCGVDYPEYFS